MVAVRSKGTDRTGSQRNIEMQKAKNAPQRLHPPWCLLKVVSATTRTLRDTEGGYALTSAADRRNGRILDDRVPLLRVAVRHLVRARLIPHRFRKAQHRRIVIREVGIDRSEAPRTDHRKTCAQ